MNLGDKVICTAKFVRVTRVRRGYSADKVWEAWPTPPRTGTYIGYRTLANGRREFEEEVGYIFEPKEHFRAALVVFSERTKPVLVPVDALVAS